MVEMVVFYFYPFSHSFYFSNLFKYNPPLPLADPFPTPHHHNRAALFAENLVGGVRLPKFQVLDPPPTHAVSRFIVQSGIAVMFNESKGK